MQHEANTPVADGGCQLCPKFTQTFMMLGKKWNGLIIEVLLESDTYDLRTLPIASASAVTGFFAND